MQHIYSIASSASASSVGGTVKRLGGLEVGHELDQLPWHRLKFSDVDAGLMNGVGYGGAITHQAACRRVSGS